MGIGFNKSSRLEIKFRREDDSEHPYTCSVVPRRLELYRADDNSVVLVQSREIRQTSALDDVLGVSLRNCLLFCPRRNLRDYTARRLFGYTLFTALQRSTRQIARRKQSSEMAVLHILSVAFDNYRRTLIFRHFPDFLISVSDNPSRLSALTSLLPITDLRLLRHAVPASLVYDFISSFFTTSFDFRNFACYNFYNAFIGEILIFMPSELKNSSSVTSPEKLVAAELKKAGFDINTVTVPERVFLLADSLYDAMLDRNCGKYKYPIGGDLYVFNDNTSVGFIKGMMCSPAIATQAEDLIATGVKELIHIGFAGGLQQDINIGDIILTDGAYNDTAVARLYGFDRDFIQSTKSLTDELQNIFFGDRTDFKRGKHWTTDAGYMETYEQVAHYRDLGALCVEMEGVGLFTVANYRNVRATAVYIVSDVLRKHVWYPGWSENTIDKAVSKIIDTVILSTRK